MNLAVAERCPSAIHSKTFASDISTFARGVNFVFSKHVTLLAILIILD